MLKSHAITAMVVITTNATYEMNGVILEAVIEEQDIGIIMKNDLKYGKRNVLRAL